MVSENSNSALPASRSIGFPRSSSPLATSSSGSTSLRAPLAAVPAPKEKRAKGRWFITLVIATLFSFIGISLWNEFFRFQAFGELEGPVVRLSSEAPGTILEVHVTEGDLVEPGQLLAKLDLRELNREERRIRREMQIALSSLQVRLAEVNTRQRELEAEHIDREIRQAQLLGEYRRNEFALEKLSYAYETNLSLRARNALSTSDLIDSKTALEGQRAQQRVLAETIQRLETPDSIRPEESALQELLTRETDRISALRAELSELDDLMQRSEIRAPVAGRILKRFSQAGELVRSGEPIVELVEVGSVEAVVYLPQNRAGVLAVGDHLNLLIRPLGTRQRFRVSRIAPEVVGPPQKLKANYRAFRGLVRVYAEPAPDSSQELQPEDYTRWVGAELALPRFGFRAGLPISKDRRTASQVADTAFGRH